MATLSLAINIALIESLALGEPVWLYQIASQVAGALFIVSMTTAWDARTLVWQCFCLLESHRLLAKALTCRL